MGKILFLDIKDFHNTIKQNLNQQTVHFIIDPRELFKYEDLNLSCYEDLDLICNECSIHDNDIKIFYSIKLESSLRLFLTRMIQYTINHKESFDDGTIPYMIYIFDVPQFNIQKIYDDFSEQIQQTNLTLYLIQED